MANIYYCTKCKRRHRIGNSPIGTPHLKYKRKDISKNVKKIKSTKKKVIKFKQKKIYVGIDKSESGSKTKVTYDLSNIDELFKQLSYEIEDSIYYFKPEDEPGMYYDDYDDERINMYSKSQVTKSYKGLGIWEPDIYTDAYDDEPHESDYDDYKLKESDYVKLENLFKKWLSNRSYNYFIGMQVSEGDKHTFNFDIYIKNKYIPKKYKRPGEW